MSRFGPFPGLVPAAALLLLVLVTPAPHADLLQPDATYRDAQLSLRLAVRDTVGQPLTAARLDSLGAAHLRLANLAEAERLLTRVLALAPGDETAVAGLGKIALFHDRPARAESLLAGLPARAEDATRDLFCARLRLGRWEQAAALAEEMGEPGRATLLRRLAEPPGSWQIRGPERVVLPWTRCWPVPIVRAKLNGQRVLLGVETGVSDLVLDPAVARSCGVTVLTDQAPLEWSGMRVSARMAMVQKLELGGLTIERIPAATTPLRRWSIEANPESETIGGLIGINLLARFTPTLDYRKCQLVLERRDAPLTFDADAVFVPFELWGERELTVYGSLGTGRRMAMVIRTGVPNCGVGAPPQVFEEVNLKPGAMSRAVRSIGTWMRGRPWAGVQVPVVTVGTLAREKLNGCSGALDATELWRYGVRRDAMLSSDFLRQHRVTIDWERHRLVFER